MPHLPIAVNNVYREMEMHYYSSTNTSPYKYQSYLPLCPVHYYYAQLERDIRPVPCPVYIYISISIIVPLLLRVAHRWATYSVIIRVTTYRDMLL